MFFITSLKKRIILAYQIKIQKKSQMDIRISEWRKAGVSVGENCRIYCDRPINRDSFLLHIGNNVTISNGTVFLCHDNAPIKVSEGKYTDVFGEIYIGDNCFIGNRAIIMPGVRLAENTIVGAGSVVTHSQLVPGYIIAGNPSRIICSVSDYYEKNKDYMVNADGLTVDEFKAYISNHKEKLIIKNNHKE